MNSKILIVEDNQEILLTLDMFLKMNDYETHTAVNGEEALQVLANLDVPPDLILSDIMMPVMNGYDFYKAVSENPNLAHIPFIFLTAKSDPDDIRFGKMLGVDDYITKPFNEDDLLATIKGKIHRSRQNQSLQQKLNEKMGNKKASLPKNDQWITFLVFWNDLAGPSLKELHPPEGEISFEIEKITMQLYDMSVGLYGFQEFSEPEGLLLHVPTIKMDAYVYYNAYDDPKMRGGLQIFMVGVVAPHIHYLQSARIREICENFAQQIVDKQEWNLENLWNQCGEILQGQ